MKYSHMNDIKKEEIYKNGNDYLCFYLKGYRVIVLRIDKDLCKIEIRKGRKDKRIFYESVKGGIKE